MSLRRGVGVVGASAAADRAPTTAQGELAARLQIETIWRLRLRRRSRAARALWIPCNIAAERLLIGPRALWRVAKHSAPASSSADARELHRSPVCRAPFDPNPDAHPRSNQPTACWRERPEHRRHREPADIHPWPSCVPLQAPQRNKAWTIQATWKGFCRSCFDRQLKI